MVNFLDWLATLPHWALYLTMAVVAAVENIFPPIPADVIVALGAVLAARGEGSPVAAFLAIWLGNVSGAMLMYAAGRRYGAGWMHRWTKKALHSTKGESKLERMYERYGLLAFLGGRLLPGIRSIVPPFAGALKVPAPRLLLIVAIPSGLWYGLATIIGFRVGSDLDGTMAILRSVQGWLAGLGVVVVIVVVAAWFVRRRAVAAPAEELPTHELTS